MAKDIVIPEWAVWVVLVAGQALGVVMAKDLSWWFTVSIGLGIGIFIGLVKRNAKA